MKERAFGLTGPEGAHGEDVKEYYFYLDSTPTHSYMKYLYKYPQAAFPYEDLKKKNQARSREEMEYELLDTGIFDEDRYFDVFVEYAKESPEDTLIKMEVEVETLAEFAQALAILRSRRGPEVLAFRPAPSTAPLRPGGSFAARVAYPVVPQYLVLAKDDWQTKDETCRLIRRSQHRGGLTPRPGHVLFLL